MLALPLLFALAPSAPTPIFPPIALINQVTFQDPRFDNDWVGTAFLLSHQGKVYACTCKHALWVAKNDAMKGIDFEGSLKAWRMVRKDKPASFVKVGRLLNADRAEPIGPANVNADWLLFEVQENHSDVQPLSLRTSPLVPGEPLFAIGWAFKDKQGPQRVFAARFHRQQGPKLLLKDEGDEPIAPGMSGSPVVDAMGRLVGIVSDYTKEERTGTWYDSPCSAEVLRRYLAKVGHP